MAAKLIKPLLDGVTGNTTGATVEVISKGIRGMYGVVQVNITGAATVRVFGRINSTFAWKELDNFTSSDASELVLFPEMKADVENYGSGTIDAALMGGGSF